MTQDRLPGTSVRAKRGRVRRQLDAYVKHLRDQDALDELGEVRVAEMRTMADKLDRDQDDESVSSFAHTAAGARFLAELDKLAPTTLAPFQWDDSDDDTGASLLGPPST